MLHTILNKLSPADGKLIWRRRIAFGTCVVANVCFIHGAFGIENVELAAKVMDYSSWLLWGAFSIYGVSASARDFLGRGRAPVAEKAGG